MPLLPHEKSLSLLCLTLLECQAVQYRDSTFESGLGCGDMFIPGNDGVSSRTRLLWRWSGFLLLCTILHYPGIPGHVYRIAHMATPAPRCSCCYAQRKSRGPEGHCDGNFLVLLLRDACFRLPHCRPAHSCRPSKEGKALASACGRLHGRPRCPTTA